MYTAPRAGSSRYAHRGRHHRGRVFAYGAPFVGYYAYSNYSCDWLLQRARTSGSDYWWDRYEACVGDY
jgi:hypothetical protein